VGEGRQPDRREETRQMLRTINSAVAALSLLDWPHVDVLPQVEVDAAIESMVKLTARSAEVWAHLANGLAKRTGQSVSGRLQPQIDALNRKLAELQDAKVQGVTESLAEENRRLRETLDRAKRLFIDGEVPAGA
jgi:hypothetical protein